MMGRKKGKEKGEKNKGEKTTRKRSVHSHGKNDTQEMTTTMRFVNVTDKMWGKEKERL